MFMKTYVHFRITYAMLLNILTGSLYYQCYKSINKLSLTEIKFMVGDLSRHFSCFALCSFVTLRSYSAFPGISRIFEFT